MGTDFCSFPFFVVSLQVLLLLQSFQNEKTLAGILLPVVIGCRSTGVAICRPTHRKRWGRAHVSRTVHAFWHGEAWPRLRRVAQCWLGADARPRVGFLTNTRQWHWRRSEVWQRAHPALSGLPFFFQYEPGLARLSAATGQRRFLFRILFHHL